MLWYCQLIADQERLVAAFNQQPGAIWTSVTGYDELSEQILEDLDGIEMLGELKNSNLPNQLKVDLERFVREFYQFDSGLGDNDPDLGSPDWKEVEAVARSAVASSEEWKIA